MSALLAQAPALPLDEAGEYVAAAYIVFVVLLVVYVGLMAAKLGRISSDLEELTELAESKQRAAGGEQREEVRA
jgi:Tfp pilus assembly protein PilO